jgi:hypothetical protein
MSTTFPVSFAALAAAAKTTIEYLTEEDDFCAILIGPDRAATISAFEKFAILLEKACGIELNGYRPAATGAPEFEAQLEMAKTISTMFGSALAGVHALESAETSDINIERFVGAILAMARDIPELERGLAVLIAKRELANKSSGDANGWDVKRFMTDPILMQSHAKSRVATTKKRVGKRAQSAK